MLGLKMQFMGLIPSQLGLLPLVISSCGSQSSQSWRRLCQLTEPQRAATGGGGGVMQFLRSGGGGGGSGFGGAAWELLRRHFSRKRSVDVRRINPKVPKEEAVAISGRLLQILSDHGPLTVGNTWNHAKVQHTLSTYVITCIK